MREPQFLDMCPFLKIIRNQFSNVIGKTLSDGREKHYVLIMRSFYELRAKGM
jgi:hypothetical protein